MKFVVDKMYWNRSSRSYVSYEASEEFETKHEAGIQYRDTELNSGEAISVTKLDGEDSEIILFRIKN